LSILLSPTIELRDLSQPSSNLLYRLCVSSVQSAFLQTALSSRHPFRSSACAASRPLPDHCSNLSGEAPLRSRSMKILSRTRCRGTRSSVLSIRSSLMVNPILRPKILTCVCRARSSKEAVVSPLSTFTRTARWCTPSRASTRPRIEMAPCTGHAAYR
ncbi:hypothetical protein TPAR_07877, partial [Tolypocladium paradoxum]